MEPFSNVKQSFKIVKEMLDDRRTNNDFLKTMSDDELEQHYNSNLIFEIPVNDNIRLIYYVNNKFKLTELKKYMNSNADNTTTNKRNILLIIKDKVTLVNNKNISEAVSVDIEVFSIKELLFNISRHIYVPHHEIVLNKQHIVNKYNLKCASQLPLILKTDPISKYYNFQSGDIIKIIRNTPSIGETVIYRYCV